MQRPRWHDIALIAGVVALLAGGVWALWGDDLRDLWRKPAPAEKATPTGDGMT
jgi:hypothetical protein